MNKQLEGMVEAYKKDKEKYNFFDINCWWDVSNNKTFHRIESFQQLKNEIKSHYINKAVITNAECIKYDVFTGNENTASLIKDSDNLFGCMVLAPEMVYNCMDVKNIIGAKNYEDEKNCMDIKNIIGAKNYEDEKNCMDVKNIIGAKNYEDEKNCIDVKKYIDEKIGQKFVAARMFPKKLNHSMKKWIIGDILAYLEEKRLPLILWHNEVSWDFLECLCQEYKNLPVVVEGNDVKLLYHNRNYIPLLKTCPNLYIETHNLVIYSEIDYLANKISDEKLLFGTYFPYNTPDYSMMTITAALISEASKHMIAGQNLKRLIDGIKR